MRRAKGRGPSGSSGAAAALAVDLDRTLTRPGSTSFRAASNVLSTVRGLGLKVILVSGREYARLTTISKQLRHVDALVAENGAVVEAPIGGPLRVIGRTTGRQVRQRLTGMLGTGAEYGEVVVSVPRPMGRKVGRLLEGLAVDLVPNVDRVMVLPEGVSKATGMRIALRALHLGSRRFAAIGDAENDIDLLREAVLSGAVGNAQPRVRAVVDHVCHAVFEAGVAEFVQGPLTEYLAARSRSEGPESGETPHSSPRLEP
jgi:hydroxymethylpyrimidine pyrophosphatase-like HAD family hydrolase